jgi:hypothetical protein
MERVRAFKQDQTLTQAEIDQGLLILDDHSVVRLDAAERALFDQYKATMLREHADASMQLSRQLLELHGGDFEALAPGVAAAKGDLRAAAALLGAALPAPADKIPQGLLAACPPLLKAYITGDPPDYMAEGVRLRMQTVSEWHLIDPVASVSQELLDSGDPRIERWKSKAINGYELMLAVGRKEAIYVRAGVAMRLDAAAQADERAALAGRALANPPQLLAAHEKWLVHKTAVLAAYPEMAAVYEMVDAEVKKADCVGCARNRYLAQIAQRAAELAVADAKAGVVRDVKPLAPLLGAEAAAFLADPAVDSAGMYLQRVVRLPPPPPKMTAPAAAPTTGSAELNPAYKSALPRIPPDRQQALNMLAGRRHNCLDCYRKHVAQAQVLLWESLKGYPLHVWIAVAHLEEAAEESDAEHPDLAMLARAQAAALELAHSAAGIDLTPLLRVATDKAQVAP